MSCTRCTGNGHTPDICPSPPSSKDSPTKCRRCGGRGHLPEVCPSPVHSASSSAPPSASAAGGGGGGEPEVPDSSEDGSASDLSSVVSCGLCQAAGGEPCEDDTCLAAADRLGRIEARKDAQRRKRRDKDKGKAPATAAGAAAGGAGGGGGDDAAAALPRAKGPSPEDVLKMTKASEIAQLEVKAIVELPEMLFTTLLAKHADRRVRFHDKFFDALEAVSQVGLPPIPDKVHFLDIEKTRWQLELMRDLTRPDDTGNLTVAVLKDRIADAAGKLGREVLALRTAREEGWTVVREALRIYAGEQQAPRQWNQSLVKARAKVGTKASPKGDKTAFRSRGGRKRGRGAAAAAGGAGGKGGKG